MTTLSARLVLDLWPHMDRLNVRMINGLQILSARAGARLGARLGTSSKRAHKRATGTHYRHVVPG
jgi:hypothetical protein